MEAIYAAFLASSGICTDTRAIKIGALFVALKGATFNGNHYVAAALVAGASMAIIDEAEYAVEGKTILVDDALKTLQELAAYHRSKLKIPFIAIGGSNGKTTTKELTSAVLAKKYSTYSTRGNFNNHIGVPLCVLEVQSSHEMAVIEMGANGHGEIALLCEIAQPTHGIITNVGKDHLEGFGSVEGVAKANAEMYEYLKANGGLVFLNTKESLLLSLAGGIQSVNYLGAQSDYPCELLPNDSWYVAGKIPSGQVINTHLVGNYNIHNIAAAIAIGKHFGVTESDAATAINVYRPSNMRSQLIETDRNTIILDTYNANPSSMEVALDTFAQFAAKRKIVVLGSMYEMGEFTEREHRLLGEKVAAMKGIDEVVFVGKEMSDAYNACPTALYFEEYNEVAMKAMFGQMQDATILIKGSRGMKLERLLESL